MPQTKSAVDAESNRALLKFQASNTRLEAEELLNEIDNLALLLHEVKKQTERIEAAADAIGDAILSRMSTDRKTPTGISRRTRRTVLTMQPRISSGLRTLSSRAPKVNDAQP